MVAYQFYRVEIDLKPMVESGGMPFSTFVLLPSFLQRPIPWSYNRNQIPDLFARKGVSLRSWERAVDSTETLFKDRNAALEHEKRGWTCFVRVMIIILFLLFLHFSSRIYATGGFSFTNYILYMLFAMLDLIIPAYLGSRAIPRISIILDRLSSHFEEQWSDQVRNLNDEYKQYGITVEASTRKIKGGGVDIPWTVGLVFSFTMQPSNEEEAARFLAHSQASDVSDATSWQRTMRIVPEAIGVTEGPGGVFSMSSALVVDNGDVNGNNEEVSMKTKLLEVV
ncbi:hypothetical protein MHU86_9862 [Fragilaria crotonensis]|nr:hypothetical protein MHU86_9862 [Fragilaria crotonensis]